MRADKEISDLLGAITPQQMDAAIAAINNYGFDISAPWECDQDDREFEMFCGLLAGSACCDLSGNPRERQWLTTSK